MGGDDGSRRITLGLAALIVLAPLPFGSVHGWSAALLQIAVWTLALAWWVGCSPVGPAGMPRAFGLAALALLAWIALPLVPLPRPWIEWLSPATAELYRQTVDLVAPADARPLAIHPFATASDLLGHLACGLVLVLAASVPAPRLLLRASVVSGVIVALIAIVQTLTWNGKLLWVFEPYEGRASYPRLSGPFVNPDHFALFLEMTLVVGAAWCLRELRRGGPRAALPLAVGLAVVAAGLIGSASRGGLSGAMIGLAVLALGTRRGAGARESAGLAPGERTPGARRRRGRHRPASVASWTRADVRRFLGSFGRRFAPAAVILAIVVGGLVYAGAQSRDVLDLRLGRTVTNPDLHVRAMRWTQSLPMVADFPVFGVGAGGWRELFPRYQRYPMRDLRPTHAHGDYVEWAVETGLVGVALTLCLAAAIVAWARGNRTIPRTLRWGIIGAIAAVGWHEIFDFGLRMPANAVLLAVLVGLCCNRHWKTEGSRSADREVGDGRGGTTRIRRFAPRRLRTAMAVAVFGILTLASMVEVREFLRWSEARAGATSVAGTPRDARTWYQLGRNRQRTEGRYAPATLAAFREAVLRRPAFAPAWWRLSRSASTFDEREEALVAALWLGPGRTSWLPAYARLLAATGRRDQIPDRIEEAVFRSPRLGEHHYLDPRRAEPSPEIVAAAGRGLDRAVAAYRDPQVLDTAADFHFRFGDWEAAGTLWERAARSTGDWKRYGLRAGESYVRAGDTEAAAQALRRAIAAAPAEPHGYRTLALSVYRPERRWEKAAEVLDRGIRRVRDPAPLWIALHDLRRERGDASGALAALERAARLRPRDARLQTRVGDAFLSTGDAARATIAYDRAIELEPERAAWHAKKGRALERLYDLAGARDAYRRARDLDPANESWTRSLERIETAFAED